MNIIGRDNRQSWISAQVGGGAQSCYRIGKKADFDARVYLTNGTTYEDLITYVIGVNTGLRGNIYLNGTLSKVNNYIHEKGKSYFNPDGYTFIFDEYTFVAVFDKTQIRQHKPEGGKFPVQLISIDIVWKVNIFETALLEGAITMGGITMGGIAAAGIAAAGVLPIGYYYHYSGIFDLVVKYGDTYDHVLSCIFNPYGKNEGDPIIYCPIYNMSCLTTTILETLDDSLNISNRINTLKFIKDFVRLTDICEKATAICLLQADGEAAQAYKYLYDRIVAIKSLFEASTFIVFEYNELIKPIANEHVRQSDELKQSIYPSNIEDYPDEVANIDLETERKLQDPFDRYKQAMTLVIGRETECPAPEQNEATSQFEKYNTIRPSVVAAINALIEILQDKPQDLNSIDKLWFMRIVDNVTVHPGAHGILSAINEDSSRVIVIKKDLAISVFTSWDFYDNISKISISYPENILTVEPESLKSYPEYSGLLKQMLQVMHESSRASSRANSQNLDYAQPSSISYAVASPIKKPISNNRDASSASRRGHGNKYDGGNRKTKKKVIKATKKKRISKSNRKTKRK